MERARVTFVLEASLARVIVAALAAEPELASRVVAAPAAVRAGSLAVVELQASRLARLGA